MTIDQKLDNIIDRLEHIEQRQITGLNRMEQRQTQGLEELKEAVPQKLGSFASSDLGDK